MHFQPTRRDRREFTRAATPWIIRQNANWVSTFVDEQSNHSTAVLEHFYVLVETQLTADALLEVEFDYAKTLLVCCERGVQVQAETLGRVWCHDDAVIELHWLCWRWVVWVAVHTESEVHFVDVRGDTDYVCVAGLETGGVNLDLGCRWGLCFFAHFCFVFCVLRVEGGFDN